jgi:hypothetical protein
MSLDMLRNAMAVPTRLRKFSKTILILSSMMLLLFISSSVALENKTKLQP